MADKSRFGPELTEGEIVDTGVFIKTIILLGLAVYKMIITNSARYLSLHIQPALVELLLSNLPFSCANAPNEIREDFSKGQKCLLVLLPNFSISCVSEYRQSTSQSVPQILLLT